MAVFLDANVLPAESRITALTFSIIRAVASVSQHQLLVPQIALDEAIAWRRRVLDRAADDLAQGLDRLRKLGIPVTAPELPSPPDMTREWADELASVVTLLPTPPDALAEAVKREIERVPPTREGRGARDAAIWLTVLNAHRDRAQPSYFLSQNTKDFGDPNNREQFHPALLRELQGIDAPLHYCASAARLLSQLGSPLDSFPDLQVLAADAASRTAVIEYASRSGFLRKLTGPSALGALFVATQVDAALSAVMGKEGYVAGGVEVVIAWTRWRLSFVLGVLTSYGASGFAQDLRPVMLEADFQVWLQRPAGSSKWQDAEVNASDQLRVVWI